MISAFQNCSFEDRTHFGTLGHPSDYNSTYQEQDGEEEMEQHGVEQDLLDEDDQLLLLHDDLAYEP